MFRFFLIQFLFLFHMGEFSESFLTDTKRNIIKSFNKEFDIKHLNIIKDFDFQVNDKILKFVKNLSEERIYANALSVSQINQSLHEYYYTSASDYFDANTLRNFDFYNKKNSLVYPPKTLSILYGKNLKEIVHYLFKKKNEIPLTKFIWLIIDKFNESHLNSGDYYIPYNSQFLILKNFTQEKNYYFIEEFYHPSPYNNVCFHNYFGNWKRNEGLTIFVRDIFKRRFDLNGTTLIGLESKNNRFKTGIRLKIDHLLILHEILQTLNINFVIITPDMIANFSNSNEIFLDIMPFDFLTYFPFCIDLQLSENKYLFIAYDKNYEGQNGVLTLLRPFSYKLWLALIFYIGISTITLTILYCFTDNLYTAILNGFYEPLESFLNQCGSESPDRHSNRTLTLANRLTALFIVPAYTGAILSIILIPTFKYPFRNMQEFVEDGSYQLMYAEEEISLGLYSQKTNDWYLKMAYEKFSSPIQEKGLGKILKSAYRKICTDHKSALLSAKFPSTDGLREFGDCKIIKIPTPVYPGWRVIYLRHGSPYLKLLNRILKLFRSSGVHQRIINDASDFWGEYKFMSYDYDDYVNLVDIDSLKSIFIVTTIFYIISLTMLIGEIIYKKVKILKLKF